MRSVHNILIGMSALLALVPAATAQKTSSKTRQNTLPAGSARIYSTTNGSAAPTIQKQGKDTCLLPPLDLEHRTVISTAQLRIPAKAKREYQRACSALAKKKFPTAERHLRKAVLEYPKYSPAWITLGQMLAEEHRIEDARGACFKAAEMEPTYVPAYLCLAEIASRTHDWREELRHSSRALELDRGNSILAYHYRAAANANLGNLEEAERSGLRAAELDKDHHEPGVYFLLAQIYKLEGDPVREDQEFQQFLKYIHDPERAIVAKQILAKLTTGQGQIIESQEPENLRDNSGRLAGPWESADIGESLSPELSDVPCPLSQILQETSQRVTELVENLQRFTATEQIEHTELKKNGKPRRSNSELFSYVAEIEQNPYAGFWVDEYRAANRPIDAPPLADTGTAALALIFHPRVIGNLETQCEGRISLRGTQAWQLRFQEGPDPIKSFSAFQIKNREYRVRLKGRAWISADNYQILRLETDLAAPIPEIRLQVEHSDVAYAAVESAKREFRLWLPQSASMHIDYRGRRYRRVHSFSHFQLFLVDSQEKVKMPVVPLPKSAAESN